MNESYLSGQNEVLRLAFQTIIAGEGSFYVGLGAGPLPDGRNKTLADVVEVTGAGYARRVVLRNADPAGWTLNAAEGTLTSPILTFTNSSADPENFWLDADYAFLSLSPAGLTAPIALFSATELVETFILAGGESKQLVVQFRLQN